MEEESIDKAKTLSFEIEKDLIEQKKLLGIDRRIAAAMVIFVALISIVTHFYWIGLAVIPMWLAIWFGTRSDPNMVDIYLRYAKQGSQYESIQKIPQRRNLRPEGFARGTLC